MSSIGYLVGLIIHIGLHIYFIKQTNDELGDYWSSLASIIVASMCSIILAIGTFNRQLWMSRLYNLSLITGMFLMLALLILRVANEEKLPFMLKAFSIRAVVMVPFITIDHFAITKPFVLFGDAGISVTAFMTFNRESSNSELQFKGSGQEAVAIAIYFISTVFAVVFSAGYR